MAAILMAISFTDEAGIVKLRHILSDIASLL